MSKSLLLLLLCILLFADEDLGPQKYTFENWRSLNLLNKKAIRSDEHNAFVGIYLNNIAKKSYVNKEKVFKIGSIIVKPLYPSAQSDDIARLVIMMKMAKGFDDDFNDWWYGVYDESGTHMWHQGAIISCIGCHIEAEDTDYLFTDSVMKKIEKINKK